MTQDKNNLLILIGYNLLREEFTLKDLQSIYETIRTKKLDRSNFQRKILSYGRSDKKEKQFTAAARKESFLYSFNKKNTPKFWNMG